MSVRAPSGEVLRGYVNGGDACLETKCVGEIMDWDYGDRFGQFSHPIALVHHQWWSITNSKIQHLGGRFAAGTWDFWLTQDFDNEWISDITSGHQWIKQYHSSSINSWFCKNHSILAIFLFWFNFPYTHRKTTWNRFCVGVLRNSEPFLVTVFSFFIFSKAECIKRGFYFMIFHIFSNSWFNRRQMLSEFTLE